MDLLDIGWEDQLRAGYAELVERRTRSGRGLPKQTERAHGLDRAVINLTIDTYRDAEIDILSVRAAFPEGEPIFEGSALTDLAHVQIAVRDNALIEDRWLEGAVS